LKVTSPYDQGGAYPLASGEPRLRVVSDDDAWWPQDTSRVDSIDLKRERALIAELSAQLADLDGHITRLK
jgi:hypothetical protein